MARETLGITAGGIDARPLPDPGFVRFRAPDHPTLGLVAELDGPPVVEAGYGEHEIIARRREVGITSYVGRSPLRITLPLLFDRYTERRTVDPEIRVLEQMHGLDPSLAAPPLLIVEGFGVPHSYSRAAHLRWRFDGQIQWGDDVRYRGEDGHRSYVPATVTILQVVEPERVRDAAGNARVTYTVPASGSPRTLRGIAKRYAQDWRKVRALNTSNRRVPRDPDRAIPAGVKVRVS